MIHDKMSADLRKLWWAPALVLGIGLALAACEPEGKDDPSPTVAGPTVKGKITITGIPADYNGRYIYGSGVVGGTQDAKMLYAVAEITTSATYKLLKIADGKAVVPLYYLNASAYVPYEGNDTITSAFTLTIFEDADGSLTTAELLALLTASPPPPSKMITGKTFTNGNLELTWNAGEGEGGDLFPAPVGKLTITEIPEENNGKYIWLMGTVSEGETPASLYGLTDITITPSFTYKMVKIADGQAEVPLYIQNAGATTVSTMFLAYNGNGTATLMVYAFTDNDGSLTTEEMSPAITAAMQAANGYKTFTSVAFSGGSASIAWSN